MWVTSREVPAGSPPSPPSPWEVHTSEEQDICSPGRLQVWKRCKEFREHTSFVLQSLRCQRTQLPKGQRFVIWLAHAERALSISGCVIGGWVQSFPQWEKTVGLPTLSQSFQYERLSRMLVCLRQLSKLGWAIVSSGLDQAAGPKAGSSTAHLFVFTMTLEKVFRPWPASLLWSGVP